MKAAHALILETSTPVGSIALVDFEGGVQERTFSSDRRHNSVLFGPLQETLKGLDALSLVLVGSGPGSYSGTRVGIAAAHGVAIAMGCPVVAVPSVLAVEEVAAGSPCLAVGDARRGTYWSARIESVAMQEVGLETAETWQETLARAASEGCTLFSFEDPSRWPVPGGVEIRVSYPNASRLWNAWNVAGESTRSTWLAQTPQPIYLKPPHITKAKSPTGRL